MRSLTKTLLCLFATLPSAYAVTLILGDTGGNARGSNAIDIQAARYSATEVASGSHAVAIGMFNTASGSDSITVGRDNSTSGSYNVNFGLSNWIYSGTTESAAVGLGNEVTGAGGLAFGYANTVFDNYGNVGGSWYGTHQFSSAFGAFNSIEPAATRSYVFGRGNTATATDTGVFGADITNGVTGSLMIGPSDVAKVTILSSGNVGIGTTAPTSKLQVVGDLNVTGTIINSGIATTGTGSTARLRVGGTANPSASWQATSIVGADGQNKVVTGYLGSSTNGAVIGAHNSALSGWADLNVAGANLIFRSSETERMRINSSGNVGVGTSAPLKKLHISGSGAGAQAILMEDTSQSANNKLWAMLLSGSTFQINSANDSGVIASSGFYMNRSGNVGLGSNPSSARFHVLDMNGTGSIRIQNPVPGSQASIDLWDGSANTASFGYTNPTPVPGSVGSLMIGTRNTTATVNIVAGSATPIPRLTVLPGGNVGVGTTAPAAKLDVNGTAQFAGDIKVKNRAVIRVSAAGDIPMIANPVGTDPEL